MITGNNKRISLILALSICLINFGTFSGYAQEDQEEEKEYIQANQLNPQAVNTLQDRTYDEGITVKEIEITGNNLVKSENILKLLNTKQGTKFDRDMIQKDLKTIYDTGFFTEKIKAVPEPSPQGIKLRIHVEENAPITGFNISGNKVISTDELAKVFDSQTGLPQNITELNKAIEDIESLYAKKGYILARVKKISDDPDGMINIQINEGIIDDIKFSGNTKTKDFVIKRNMLTTPGMVYNENILKQDLSRIFATQSFSDVRRVLSASPEDPDKYLLTIEVDEKRTGTISFGGGIDTVSGLFGTIGYMDRNFRGVGQEIGLSFLTGSGVIYRNDDQLRRLSFQLEANFVEPRLKQTLNSLEISGYGREYGSWQIPLAIERRIGSQITVARPIKRVPHLAGSIMLGVENVDLEEGDFAEISRLFNERGMDITERAKQLNGGTFVSFGPSLVYDTRNSMINTTSGWYANASLIESFAVSGETGTFGKVSLGVRRFYPIGKKSTFTVGGKIGSKVIGDLPEFAAFRLGGSDTIRGFWEGDVGNGQGFMMGTAEVRTPLPFIDKITKIGFFNDMRLAAFLDAGTLFRTTSSSKIYNRPGYAISTGLGLRVMIPGMGPIRVDYGYPITYAGTGNRRGRFTFGFGDKL